MGTWHWSESLWCTHNISATLQSTFISRVELETETSVFQYRKQDSGRSSAYLLCRTLIVWGLKRERSLAEYLCSVEHMAKLCATQGQIKLSSTILCCSVKIESPEFLLGLWCKIRPLLGNTTTAHPTSPLAHQILIWKCRSLSIWFRIQLWAAYHSQKLLTVTTDCSTSVLRTQSYDTQSFLPTICT